MNSNKTVDGNSVHENMMVDLDYHEIIFSNGPE